MLCLVPDHETLKRAALKTTLAQEIPDHLTGHIIIPENGAVYIGRANVPPDGWAFRVPVAWAMVSSKHARITYKDADQVLVCLWLVHDCCDIGASLCETSRTAVVSSGQQQRFQIQRPWRGRLQPQQASPCCTSMLATAHPR